MNLSIFDHRRIRQGLTLLFLASALACMFPPGLPAFVWWTSQAPYVAIGYLLLGLFFLVVGRPRLMFVCLGCSAAISFFFNEAAEHKHPPAVPVGWFSTDGGFDFSHPEFIVAYGLASPDR